MIGEGAPRAWLRDQSTALAVLQNSTTTIVYAENGATKIGGAGAAVMEEVVSLRSGWANVEDRIKRIIFKVKNKGNENK
ncbi:hypothetical protein [Paenibacillus sp. sgz302251]|uniref:hypothetical protein n=1 Tax=Paenibacillus sp. sgz302251 TaxID=3414493 RepID=UPI003C79DB1B